MILCFNDNNNSKITLVGTVTVPLLSPHYVVTFCSEIEVQQRFSGTARKPAACFGFRGVTVSKAQTLPCTGQVQEYLELIPK